MSDRSAEQRAWEIIGYLGDVDVNQLDPDSGDAATFERALAEIAAVRAAARADTELATSVMLEERKRRVAAERELADANGHVAALTAALTTRRSACDEESERADAAERQLVELREIMAKELIRKDRQERTLEGQLAKMRTALDAARKPENYWRQVAEATELTKKGLEQDNVILREERDDLQQDIEKQNKDIDEHQARWQRAERELAEMRTALEWYASCDIAAKAVCEGSYCRMEHDDGDRARTALQNRDP